MAKRYKKAADIPTAIRRELQAKREFRRRWMMFTILPVAYVVMSGVFLVVIVLGVMPTPDDPGPTPVWPILVILSVFEVPMLALVTKRTLRPLRKAKTIGAIAGAGMTPLIVAMAIGASIVVYALIGSMFAMPPWIQLGLWFFGVGVIIGAAVWVRGQVRDAMVLALANAQGD